MGDLKIIHVICVFLMMKPMVKKGAKILRNSHLIGWLKGALEKVCPLTCVPGVFHTSLEGCVLAGQRPSLYFFILIKLHLQLFV